MPSEDQDGGDNFKHEDIINNVLRHRNDGFAHPFASEQSPGTVDFARLLRALEGANFEKLSKILEAVDTVASSHRSCQTCYGKILAFAELLAINRIPASHAIYAKATESLARETGRDFRREVLEYLSVYYRPVRPRICSREMLEKYQEIIRSSPWALHLEGLSEDLASVLSSRSEWILVVGKRNSENVIERLQANQLGALKPLRFVVARLRHESISPHERCVIFWSCRDGDYIQGKILDAMPDDSSAVWYVERRLHTFGKNVASLRHGSHDRLSEALQSLLRLDAPPTIERLNCQSGFEAMTRHKRGETLLFPAATSTKNSSSKSALNELRRRRQQRISDAIVDPAMPQEVKTLLLNCMPLWKDDPDSLIGELLPQRSKQK